jgi:ABC-type multidrug transport system fused ATPase/permease subunit
MAFIPAAFANFVMYEKESKCYHQQIVSGVSLSAYWLSTWLWDNLTYQLAAWLILILIIVFPNTSLLTGQEPLGAFIGLFMLFGPAIIGFTYMTTFFFKTASSGQLITVFINLILGLGLTITTLVLRFIPSTHDLHVNVLRYIFVLFPPCALGEGMNNLALRNFYSDLELGGNKQYDVLDWNICGLNLLVMGIESIVFIVATIALDYVASQPQIRNLLDPKSDLVEGEGKDDDVTAEEEMVAAKDDRAASAAVLVQNVKKKYSSGTYAVKGVSLAIPHGECFGLLGVNGAG